MSSQSEDLVVKNDKAKALALEINSCREVIDALNDKSHPCHEVVKWQADQWKQPILQIENSKMHRPEAWTGDIVNAPILFLSSNPSFNEDEKYPNWQLNEKELQLDWGIYDFCFEENELEILKKIDYSWHSEVIKKLLPK
jgi:hypothetical protein